jgi:putative tricarboxylic transport membrane protein
MTNRLEMPRTDKRVGIFFLILSGYVCWKSVQLGLGAFRKPGPGFISFWSGLFLGMLALLLFIQNIWLNKPKLAEEEKEKTNWRAILTVFASLFAYILLVNYLGFIITTILFVGILLKGIEKKGWFLATWVSLLLSFGSYIVFKVWLQSELPKGMFGF